MRKALNMRCTLEQREVIKQFRYLMGARSLAEAICMATELLSDVVRDKNLITEFILNEAQIRYRTHTIKSKIKVEKLLKEMEQAEKEIPDFEEKE